jgi:hypothetical protein
VPLELIKERKDLASTARFRVLRQDLRALQIPHHDRFRGRDASLLVCYDRDSWNVRATAGESQCSYSLPI